jgi:hypothetical protein
METVKDSPVMATQGNVIFCNFGACAADPVGSRDPLDEALIGVRTAIDDINGVVSETFSVHTEASAMERDAAQLLIKALDSMDIVAFQSRILLAGADDCRDGDGTAVVTSLRRFVSAAAVVGQRLHALAREHRSWIGAEERVLRDIVAHAAQLEATAADCIRTMRSDRHLTDSAV